MTFKTKYKHLIFSLADVNQEEKTVVYICENKSGDFLGTVEYYPPWKQYIFNVDSGLFSVSCLKDIADFISQEQFKKLT